MGKYTARIKENFLIALLDTYIIDKVSDYFRHVGTFIWTNIGKILSNFEILIDNFSIVIGFSMRFTKCTHSNLSKCIEVSTQHQNSKSVSA